MSVDLFKNESMSNITGSIVISDSNSSGEIPDVPEVDQLQRVLNGLGYFDYFYFPTFLLLGLVGNTMTIIIMNNKSFSKLNSRLLLICLAFSDTLLLLTQPFNKKFVIKMLGTDLRALSDIGCKTFFVFFRTGKMTSSWIVVFLCVERFVAVWFPLKAKRITTKLRTIIALIVVYLVMITFNSVWSFSSLIINGMCYPDAYDRSDPFLSTKYENMIYMGCALYSIGPMCIMAVLTILILYKLAVYRHKRKQMTSHASKSDTEGVKTTAMLLGIVTAYIVLVLPVTMLHLMAFFFKINAFGNNAKGFLVFKEVSQLLEQLNYSINFFLYITTSTQFREGLYDLLKIAKCQKCYRSIMRSADSNQQTNSTKNNKSKKSSQERNCNAKGSPIEVDVVNGDQHGGADGADEKPMPFFQVEPDKGPSLNAMNNQL
ncbi:C-C chemokine receptor type 2-like [Mizuhopecten yessoensis]|uniref:G-protein coupled receptor 139 n=1 Tax=Mizuhopecten yessoensis TaxID=6573 RepID=A0A210PZT0_MIZYE|nr:C-C chemokine receptor type 2-like [Mizuhopecten yessoensis]OWF42000.1 G-protein coupled receptor 139 [Mizuhopecten yessoensis]